MWEEALSWEVWSLLLPGQSPNGLERGARRPSFLLKDTLLGSGDFFVEPLDDMTSLGEDPACSP